MNTTLSFEERFETQFKLSPNNAINEFRTEVDPYSSFNEYASEYEFNNTDSTDDDEHQSFNDWMERAEAALSGYQETLSEKYETRNTTDELSNEPEFKANKLSNYTTKTTVSVDTSFTDGQKISTRELWDRTSGWDSSTIVLTEYGIFNPYSNNASQKAMMRVRKVIRNHIMWLTMGSININLDDLTYYCGQHNCEFHGSLELANLSNDVEFQEYVILLLLQHLGTHNPFNNLDYPFPPIKRVAKFHNTEAYLIQSHMYYCNNKKCNHSYI